jgi:hypothetical protein
MFAPPRAFHRFDETAKFSKSLLCRAFEPEKSATFPENALRDALSLRPEKGAVNRTG